jgi:polyhydroxyalkanoate synthesis regulator phasin
MSKFYLKGKGRKTALERSQMSTIEELIEQHDIDISEYNPASTPHELEELRNQLVDKYGTPPVKKPETQSAKPSPAPVESNSSSGDTEFAEPEFADPEPTKAEDITSSSTRTFDLSEFVPTQAKSPFEDHFPAEDMHKAHNDFPTIEPQPEPTKVQQTQTDSTPNAWEVLKNRSDKVNSIDRIDDPEPIASEPSKSDSGDGKKVPLSSEARKKANESFARQTAKIFSWLSESGVKYFSKVKDKHITELEQEGLLDRNYEVGGKTVAELLEQHHELIDEMVKVDPQSKNDLIEAIKLVAEEYEVEMSPMANLGMVIVTILLTMAQAGIQTKREFKRHLKKVSDQYVMQKRQITPMQNRIDELEQQLRTQSPKAPAQPEPSSFSQPVELSLEEPIKELSFAKKDTTGLNIRRSSPAEIQEESSSLDEIGSEVDEGTVTVKKNGRIARKKGTVPTGKK